MCSIFGSNNIIKFFELAEINRYRGTHSHSIAVLKSNDIIFMHRGFGPLLEVDLPNGDLYIGHQQAPTTNVKDNTSIHPAAVDNTYLWHNGIIKNHVINEWRQKYHQNWSWDTRWLLYHLINGTETLDSIDGSFACLYYNSSKMKLFRNENCPMYVDGVNFSSTLFEHSTPIEAGVVYEYQHTSWEKTLETFNTKNYFFWSPD